MAEVCPDCARPFADDACGSCHRSKRGGWPMGKPLDIGRGGPGLNRDSPAGRLYQMSFRLDVVLVGKLKALASEQGCAVGKVVRELIEDGLRHRRPARVEPDAEYLARRARFSTPGNAPQRPAERLRPVHQYGTFER